ncbi:hypothetical protein FHS16_001950 [Paenibacillus endophyticus]|uniref:Copper amine oxidase-like N-terminal domain-containing protein n=1 Tax=Paenibacillus endophyticus TaxID=1294268 RepID=A0A7W5C757_9BACL|nr:copper amine oxidase N-terminal domain-containing protein [Paenibacillus endophyticus]MBB3151904.1 hypothetical protein [Paenibacillus endophyticus]
MNNRIMVPLRVISENLGASVFWSNSEVILAKNNIKVVLTLNSNIVMKSGVKMLLDVKPCIKENRIFVPLRFIAETFDCHVSYSKFKVNVETKPFLINGVELKALQKNGFLKVISNTVA